MIDWESRGVVVVATQVAGASCCRTRGSAERALGMRTVKHEWGVNVIGVVNKCTYWCIYRAL